MPRQDWTIPAEPREVSRLRSAVVTFAIEQGVLDPPIGDLKLAVSEAMTNVIVHAYGRGDGGKVDVSVSVEPGREITVVVVDTGAGMNPRADSPGMGLGLPLIGNLADSLQITTPAGGRGTEVRMSFALSA